MHANFIGQILNWVNCHDTDFTVKGQSADVNGITFSNGLD